MKFYNAYINQYLKLFNKAKWTLPIRDWKPAMGQFMLMYGDRISG
ncbi:hypothetical protein [Symbiopectobacterium purcellii]